MKRSLWIVLLLLLLMQIAPAFATDVCEHSFRCATPVSERATTNTWVLECEFCGEKRDITFAERECSHSFRNATPYPVMQSQMRWLECEKCKEVQVVVLVPVSRFIQQKTIKMICRLN